jgi:hypothetical protein
MAKSPQKDTKIGLQHSLFFLVAVVAVFIVTQFKIIPIGISGFVVPLFEPNGEVMIKSGFVKFNGSVWATPKSINTFPEMGEKGKKISVSTEIAKDKINGEYIFDFTYTARHEESHGYVKGSQEFYAKSPVLGEHAIILEPWIGFTILSAVFAVVFVMLITILMPIKLGAMALLFDRQIDETKIKIRLQTGFPEEVIEILTLPEKDLEAKDKNAMRRDFKIVWDRTNTEEVGSMKKTMSFDVEYEKLEIVEFRHLIFNRIKEFFSDFVLKEIEDTKEGLEWRKNHFLIGKGMKLYMSHHFTEKYANNVTGLAYGGAAILIIAVGIRGLKFIPPTKPSFILLAIFLEFSMLSLMALTLVYTEEEERMDKMLKKMEDANREQLEELKTQRFDIHRLTEALVGQTAEIIQKRVQEAIREYMMSDDKIKKVVAEEISDKLMSALRESFSKDNPKLK